MCVCMYILNICIYETSWKLIHAGSLWHAGAKNTAGELIYIIYKHTYIYIYACVFMHIYIYLKYMYI